MKSVQMLMMGAKKERSKFGLMYNSIAAQDVNLLPDDWELPTSTEWSTLVSYMTSALNDIRKVGTEWWNFTGATDDYDFGAVGAGSRETTFTDFKDLALYSIYDSFDEFVRIDQYGINVGYPLDTDTGCSVRAIWKGSGTPNSTIIDYDGNVYDVVLIGTQYWIAQNWRCTHLDNGTSIPYEPDDIDWSGATTKLYCYPDNDIDNV